MVRMLLAVPSPLSDTALTQTPSPLKLIRAMPLCRLAGFWPVTVKPTKMLPERSAVSGVEI